MNTQRGKVYGEKNGLNKMNHDELNYLLEKVSLIHTTNLPRGMRTKARKGKKGEKKAASHKIEEKDLCHTISQMIWMVFLHGLISPDPNAARVSYSIHMHTSVSQSLKQKNPHAK